MGVAAVLLSAGIFIVSGMLHDMRAQAQIAQSRAEDASADARALLAARGAPWRWLPHDEIILSTSSHITYVPPKPEQHETEIEESIVNSVYSVT